MSEEILVDAFLSRDNLMRGSSNEPVNARFRIETSESFVQQHPVSLCDVVLVVDTSGSMDDPFTDGLSISKREGVIQAAKEMVRHCNRGDRISLICFDTKAYTELEDVPASDLDGINSGLDKIRDHGGMTNFEKAFKQTQQVIRNLKQPSKRVVFLTDGNATSGKIDVAHRINRELAQAGVTVDCFGVGSDYDHHLMLSFTQASGGLAYHLPSPDEAAGLFEESLRTAQQSLISNAVLTLEVPSHFRDVEFYQATPQQHNLSVPEGTVQKMKIFRVHLSALAQQDIYNFVLHAGVDIPSGSASNSLFARVRLTYDVPVRQLRSQEAKHALFLSFSNNPDDEVRRSDVDDMYLTATLMKLEGEMQAAAQANDWKRTGAILDSMCKRAKSLNRLDLVAGYETQLRQLQQNGLLTQADLNKLSQSTSQAQSQMARKQPSSSMLGADF
ncbi:MAG: VWA domain-containing protein [Candidatus Hydrogenedens sp.]|jgi:hypothetical protein|nr:VWA domain-containing protein [Candidatus Hydrogenedens sp.]